MKKTAKVVAVVVVLQAIFVAIWLVGRSDAPPETPRPAVVEVRDETELDEPAPPLRYGTLAGETGSLADHRGKPVVVHFWGTWCPPCVDELPRLLAWPRSGDVVLLAVAIDDDEESLRAFFDGDVPDDVVLAAESTTGIFDVDRLPVTFFVDASGAVLRRWRGPRQWTDDQRQSFTRRD